MAGSRDFGGFLKCGMSESVALDTWPATDEKKTRHVSDGKTHRV